MPIPACEGEGEGEGRHTSVPRHRWPASTTTVRPEIATEDQHLTQNTGVAVRSLSPSD